MKLGKKHFLEILQHLLEEMLSQCNFASVMKNAVSCGSY